MKLVLNPRANGISIDPLKAPWTNGTSAEHKAMTLELKQWLWSFGLVPKLQQYITIISLHFTYAL